MPELELSIVMPCLNEAQTLPNCITKAHRFLAEEEVAGEIIVADNGSRDGSQQIARDLGCAPDRRARARLWCCTNGRVSRPLRDSM